MGVELFPETSENHILTRLSARENFIEIYSLYSCNAEYNNIVYKLMNYPNQFIVSQREGKVNQSVSSSFVSQSDGSVAICCSGISLRRSWGDLVCQTWPRRPVVPVYPPVSHETLDASYHSHSSYQHDSHRNFRGSWNLRIATKA